MLATGMQVRLPYEVAVAVEDACGFLAGSLAQRVALVCIAKQYSATGLSSAH